MTSAAKKPGAPRHFTDLSTVSTADLRAILDDAGRRKAMADGESEESSLRQVMSAQDNLIVVARARLKSSSVNHDHRGPGAGSGWFVNAPFQSHAGIALRSRVNLDDR